MRPAAPLVLVALSLVLAACGNESASAPGEVSPGEAKALDDAASMLDERKLPPEAIPTDAPSTSPPPASPAEMTGDAAPARQ
jgi:predicted small secreted protein